jgi:hypothetical protein
MLCNVLTLCSVSLVIIDTPSSARSVLELSFICLDLLFHDERAHIPSRVHVVGKLEGLKYKCNCSVTFFEHVGKYIEDLSLIIFVRQRVKVLLGEGTNGSKYASPTHGKAKACLTSLGVVVREVSIAFISEVKFEHGFAEISNTNFNGTKLRHRRALNSSWLQIDLPEVFGVFARVTVVVHVPLRDDLAVDPRDTDRAAGTDRGRQTGSQLSDLFLKFVHDHVSQDRGYKGGKIRHGA